GLLWLVIGVCLAGAVQDMLVMAASVRRDGKSLAEIARVELGPWANLVVSMAILFIVVIALAGLGFVVVKALGGQEFALGKGTVVGLPAEERPQRDSARSTADALIYPFPEKCRIRYPGVEQESLRPEAFSLRVPVATPLPEGGDHVPLPAGAVQLVKGSS